MFGLSISLPMAGRPASGGPTLFFVMVGPAFAAGPSHVRKEAQIFYAVIPAKAGIQGE
jgi:hypothetical protein